MPLRIRNHNPLQRRKLEEHLLQQEVPRRRRDQRRNRPHDPRFQILARQRALRRRRRFVIFFFFSVTKRRRADDDAALELAPEGGLPLEEFRIDGSAIAVKLEVEEGDVAEGVEEERRALSGRIEGKKGTMMAMAAKEAEGFDEDGTREAKRLETERQRIRDLASRILLKMTRRRWSGM
ncbi:F-box protein [Senna tora]|uniref:F-box protein n=1 Tax=Senna tora TaxID=362788 RepID=A0A834T5I7_9FABA|nr:F-box protein [Senna tora]